MDSPILLHGHYPDVLTLIDRVEAVPQTQNSVGDPGDNWDALAADIAAAHFVGDILRWYEGLDIPTQESWASLRASLLATFDPLGEVLSDDDEGGDRFTYPQISSMTEVHRLTLLFRGGKNSCLVAWPAPPPFSLPGFHERQVGSGMSSEEPRPVASSKSVNSGVINGLYTLKMQKSILQRLSTVSRMGRRLSSTPGHPEPPQSPAVSHFIIDLMETTPQYHRAGWNTIEIELPPTSEIKPATFRIPEPIPLSSKQLDYARVGFRLTEVPAPNEKTHVYLLYNIGLSSSRGTRHTTDWKPDPVRLLSKTVFAYFEAYSAFRQGLKPGFLIKSSLTTTSNVAWGEEPVQVLVEWKLGG